MAVVGSQDEDYFDIWVFNDLLRRGGLVGDVKLGSTMIYRFS